MHENGLYFLRIENILIGIYCRKKPRERKTKRAEFPS